MALSFDELPAFARKAYFAAKARASVKSLALLSREEFVSLWERSGGRCELSGLQFTSEPEDIPFETGFVRSGSRPWEPSLDQIKPSIGYSFENCQLLCKAVNLGKNGYTQETFLKWVKAVAACEGGNLQEMDGAQ